MVAAGTQLPELGQVWGDKTAFDTFRQNVQAHYPEHWQALCTWFQSATRDRENLELSTHT